MAGIGKGIQVEQGGGGQEEAWLLGRTSIKILLYSAFIMPLIYKHATFIIYSIYIVFYKSFSALRFAFQFKMVLCLYWNTQKITLLSAPAPVRIM